MNARNGQEGTTMSRDEQIAFCDWLIGLPADRRPTSGDEALRLRDHWLLARRAGCDAVEIVAPVRP